MPLFRSLLPGLLLMPLAAAAQEASYRSDLGVAYEVVPGGPGAVLRSLSPQGYSIGFAGQPVEGVETIRLSPDCTAKSALVGAGHWFRTGEGFSAIFVEGASVTFQGQPPEAVGPGCAAPAGEPSAPAVWHSGNGTPYDYAEEGGEGVLRSQSDQTYRPGHMGDAAPAVTGPETIRLRADCTASGTLLGDGSWMRIDGTVIVSWLAGDAITFDQAPPEAIGPGCQA
jgi:hypothetical protein